MKHYLIMLLLFHAITCTGQTLFQLKGKVVSAINETPLSGVNIHFNQQNNTVYTDNNGVFSFNLPKGKHELSISYMGYKTEIVSIELPFNDVLIIKLNESENKLSEVQISTGYQVLSKERSTGSFVHVDQALFNRSVGTNALDRLKDVVPGLIFNRGKRATSNNDITIRGLSTINANAKPLIVIDNFPYEGDIDNINPNDVETITILKDAAAASIWGARAGNGVIVITTKKGRINQSLQVSFNGNITIGAKPDLFNQPKMSSADYIETEKRLFEEGYYQKYELSKNSPFLSPVIELLIAKRDDVSLKNEVDNKIENLKSIDVRNDIDRYFNRLSLNQQYALSLSNSTEKQRYYISAGFDKNLHNARENQDNRTTLSVKNTYNLTKKIDLNFAGNLSKSIREQNNNSFTSYPYAKLVDDQGIALTVNRDYRNGFKENAEQKGLLNWDYKPYDEIFAANNKSTQYEYRFNTSLNYKVISGLDLTFLYQLAHFNTNVDNIKGPETYETRNEINRFSQINSSGLVIRPIPIGSIADYNESKVQNNSVRAQLNYNKVLQEHEITALLGSEWNATDQSIKDYRLYGYDEEHAIANPVDYFKSFPSYINPASSIFIRRNDQLKVLADRFISYYTNIAYSYNSIYTFSASLRTDKSNLFGVKANQKKVPLYAIGLGWDIYKESFFKFSWLNYLKLKATYGYNGNIDKTVSAYTTARYMDGANTITRLPYADIVNPPNPELRWERVKVINYGLDFRILENRVSGSIEYFTKSGIDLIGSSPLAPSMGVTTFKGNTANIKGRGMDFSVNARLLEKGIKWDSNFFLSFVTDKVTSYKVNGSVTNYLQSDAVGIFPLVGKPLYGIYSYLWAGLDPVNGNPMGYYNGVPSTEYNLMATAATVDNIVYHGSARPEYYGAWRNTFNWRNFSLSANISFRFKYFFRKNSIYYGEVYGLNGHGDYQLRWKKTGDEQHTQVPSIPATPNLSRDNFYQYSSVLIAKGDHIRFQDLKIGYDLNKLNFKNLPFQSIQCYLYADNIGLIWKANSAGIDPDYITGPTPRSIALGAKLSF
jgi:TonB-linked SusC/RagA family outer membrane protein